MVEGGEPVSGDALADIAYLARSKNRIEILETLASGARSTREMEASTGVSRSTLERITSELEERGWAERTADGEYALTDRGKYVAAETGAYVGAIQTVEALGDAVSWLPDEELTVGLRHFRDAVVRRPEPNDIAAADTRLVDMVRAADEFACLSNTAGTVGLETAMMEEFAEGRLDVLNVVTPEELEVYRRDSERAARWKEYVEAGADVFCYRGRIPCNLVLVDETVLVMARCPETVGLIESTDETVRRGPRGCSSATGTTPSGSTRRRSSSRRPWTRPATAKATARRVRV